ncbi:glycosyltransferase [Cellulomonas marina]|uniref:Glycosyltransferase involved in cell wall bisynthesis n=1 Tax=Cellulomonas marina TaxID=988821 RepID=A0A1I0X0D6_9CELL|nr:glycosyltransferase [Cellulomonas marina]GIG29356.1 hypothetical protein Cma02nite_19560 [Cellulomonas marina]SFA94449.1 Glycosyltransferase involved in cell wall bisynthesis [Cellulomonas marina]
MIKVAVANEYNLRDNVPRFHEGRYARHLLFGVQRLVGPEFAVRFVGERLPGRLGADRRLRALATNLRALAACLPGPGRADVVYATHTWTAVLPGLVKRLTGRPRRLVTIVHGLPGSVRSRPGLFGQVFGAHDALVFLSPTDLAAVRPGLRPGQDAFLAPWGPSEEWGHVDADVSSAHLRPSGAPDEPFVFAIGKSKRDWATLAAAQRLAGFPLVVVAGPRCEVEPSPRVAVHQPSPGTGEALPLDEVLALYRDARVLVLPLVEDPSLNGSTALVEALASGSRVVMTATRAMAGFADLYPGWVLTAPPGDAAALADAITRALTEPLPAPRPVLPTAERFEAKVLAVLTGRRSDEVTG